MNLSVTPREQAILERIVLPPRPEVLLQIADEAKKEEPNVAHVAQLIASDPGLAAAVLQVVNSPAYRRAREITAIQQAVMLLGFKRLFPLVKAVALRASFERATDLEQFWQINQEIAEITALAMMDLGRSDLMELGYSLGLFHAAGIPVLSAAFETYLAEFQAQKDSLLWLEHEQSKWGVQHSTISALLADKWGLSQSLIQAIYYQYTCQDLWRSDEIHADTLLLLAALKCARVAVLSKHGFDLSQEWHAIKDEMCEFLGWDDLKADEMLIALQDSL